MEAFGAAWQVLHVAPSGSPVGGCTRGPRGTTVSQCGSPRLSRVGRHHMLKATTLIVIFEMKASCPSWTGLGMGSEWLLAFVWLSHFGSSPFCWAVSHSTSGTLVLLPGQVVTASSWIPVVLGLPFSALPLTLEKQLNRPGKSDLTPARWCCFTCREAVGGPLPACPMLLCLGL